MRIHLHAGVAKLWGACSRRTRVGGRLNALSTVLALLGRGLLLP